MSASAEHREREHVQVVCKRKTSGREKEGRRANNVECSFVGIVELLSKL